MSDRAIAVEGSVNLRDFGGYTTARGERVARGRLFRCGTLAHITERGRDQFTELGVGLICDLRRPDEKLEDPTPFPEDAPKRLEIPIDPGSAMEMRRLLTETDLGFDDRVRFMTALTGELTRDHAPDYARMFEALLDLDGGGFLVHCSAGKDRTGVACALILHALGVSREVVVEDYLLTNQVMDYDGWVVPRLLKRAPGAALPDRDLVMTLAGVREEYLNAAYASVHEQFENIEHYLEHALGLGESARSALRRRYLEA